MKHRYILELRLPFLLLLASVTASAQVKFQRVYVGSSQSDEGFSTQPTSDGGIVIGGMTSSFGAGSNDFLIIRAGSDGSTLWTRTFGGASDDVARSVSQTSGGSFVLAGHTFSGSYNGMILQVSSAGALQWGRTFGGAGYEDAYNALQTGDGGYVAAGSSSTAGGAGAYDVYLLKMTSTAAFGWARLFGGAGWDYGYNVRQTTDAGYILCGSTSSFTAGSYDAYLLKINCNGGIQWTRSFGRWAEDNAYSVVQTSDGEYAVTGITWETGDPFLLRVSAQGTLLWANLYDFGSAQDIAYDLRQTSDGGFIVAGEYSDPFFAFLSRAFLLKTSSSGALEWSSGYGGSSSESPRSVSIASDGGFLVSGYSVNSFVSTGNHEIYLVRTDAGGASGCNEYVLSPTVSAWAASTNTGGSTNAGSSSGSTGPGNSSPSHTNTLLCSVLPAGLLWYRAERTDNTVRLSWKTAEEPFCDYFRIEKTLDGGDFLEIGKIPPASSHTYRFEDAPAPESMCGYRLSQAGYDGNIHLLGMQWIDPGHAMQWSAAATAKLLEITYVSGQETGLSFRVMDMNGKEFMVRDERLHKGTGKLVWDISELGPGYYLLQASGPSSAGTMPFHKP